MTALWNGTNTHVSLIRSDFELMEQLHLNVLGMFLCVIPDQIFTLPQQGIKSELCVRSSRTVSHLHDACDYRFMAVWNEGTAALRLNPLWPACSVGSDLLTSQKEVMGWFSSSCDAWSDWSRSAMWEQLSSSLVRTSRHQTEESGSLLLPCCCNSPGCFKARLC